MDIKQLLQDSPKEVSYGRLILTSTRKNGELSLCLRRSVFKAGEEVFTTVSKDCPEAYGNTARFFKEYLEYVIQQNEADLTAMRNMLAGLED